MRTAGSWQQAGGGERSAKRQAHSVADDAQTHRRGAPCATRCALCVAVRCPADAGGCRMSLSKGVHRWIRHGLRRRSLGSLDSARERGVSTASCSGCGLGGVRLLRRLDARRRPRGADGRLGQSDRTPGRHESGAPAVATGSHLDTVPEGGNYDGGVGSVAGLGAIIATQGARTAPPPLGAVCLSRGRVEPVRHSHHGQQGHERHRQRRGLAEA